MSKQLGDKLKALRKSRGWTQQDLAKRSGVKRGYLASIEAGLVGNPSAQVFLKIAGAFGISPDELYQAAGYLEDNRGAPAKPATPEEVIDLLKAVQPAAIPLYRWDDYPCRGEKATPPVGYVYRARSRAVGREMTAYIVSGSHGEPLLGGNDIIIVDWEEQLEEGEIVACRLGRVPIIGYFREVAGESYIEIGSGRARLDDCEAPAQVIEMRRWLEEDDWSTVYS